MNNFLLIRCYQLIDGIGVYINVIIVNKYILLLNINI